MASSETVIISRFQIPPELVSARRPEHEVSCNFCGERVEYLSALSDVSPLRPYARHELRLLGDCPRLLEKKIGIPFGKPTREERRDAGLQLEPMLNGGAFCG